MANHSESNREVWNKLASRYDSEAWGQTLSRSLIGGIRDQLAFIGAAWSSQNDGREVRLLDYACGTGMMTRALKDYITTARGIDISEEMVTLYNARMQADDPPQRGSTASAVAGDLLCKDLSPSLLAALKGPEYSDFDVAAVALGFHHFEDPVLALVRLAERLKGGTGVLVVLDWLPSDRDPKYRGPLGGMAHRHGHGHGHGHGHHSHHGGREKGHEQGPEKAESELPRMEDQDEGEAEDHFESARHTIVHDGFDEEMMRKLYEDAGLVDFGFVTFDEPIELRMQGKSVWRTPFLARGRRS